MEGRIEARAAMLHTFFESVGHTVSSQTTRIALDELAGILESAGRELLDHIRTREWLTNRDGYSWFNGYYDNAGRRLEGDGAEGVRMTLTGQVFTLLGGIAGYRGGVVDYFISRFIDVMTAFPSILFAILTKALVEWWKPSRR